MPAISPFCPFEARRNHAAWRDRHHLGHGFYRWGLVIRCDLGFRFRLAVVDAVGSLVTLVQHQDDAPHKQDREDEGEAELDHHGPLDAGCGISGAASVVCVSSEGSDAGSTGMQVQSLSPRQLPSSHLVQ